jgi:hypothetical protein
MPVENLSILISIFGLYRWPFLHAIAFEGRFEITISLNMHDMKLDEDSNSVQVSSLFLRVNTDGSQLQS